MLKTRRSIQRLSQVAAACLFTGLGVYAQAQDLNVENGAVTVTGEAAFSASPTVGADGLVTQVTGLPLATNQLLPGFSFQLLNEGVADGTYTFRIGITVDDDNSQRRLEAVINQLQLDVAGGVITGTNPVTQSLDFIGRDSTGTLTIALNDPILNDDPNNGPISVTAGEVELDADDLINRIEVSSLALADMVDEFDDPGHFTYRIAVYQIGGPASIRFGTGATFSAFPRIQTNCDNSAASRSASVFTLNSSEFAGQFPLAYAVQGQYSVSGAAGSAGSAPTAFTEDCSSGGGNTGGGNTGGGNTGGSGEDPEVPIDDQIADIDDQLGDILLPVTGTPTAEQQTAIETALDSTLQLASDAVTQSTRSNTEFTNPQALASLETINDALDLAADANEKGATVDSTKAFNAARSVADVLTNIKSRSLTPDQKEEFTEAAQDALASVTRLINSATDANNLANLIAVATDTLAAITEMNGGSELSEDLVATIKGMSTAVMDNQFTKPGTSVFLDSVDANDKEAVKALVAQKPALAFLLRQNATKTPDSRTQQQREQQELQLRFTFEISTPMTDEEIEALISELQSELANTLGVPSSSINIVFSDSSSIRLARASGSQAATAALSISAVDDDAVPYYKLSNAESTFWLTSGGLSLFADTMPDGLTYLPQGNFLITENGNGYEYTPQAYDVLGFIALLENAELSPTLTDDQNWLIDIGSGASVSIGFAMDDIGVPTEACGDISVGLPSGTVVDPEHAYTVSCANGVTQNAQPFLGDTALYETLVEIGLEVSTDRNTGIITVEDIGQFKPSFFVYELTFEEQVFLSANEGDIGMAFQATDANGDGKLDYVYLTENGSQVLYGLQ